MSTFNRPIAEPMHEGERGAALSMVAEVYSGAREYERTTRWNTPRVVRLRPDDHLDGIHWRACEDCGGTGHFPVPWDVSQPGEPSDFCVACKGTGLEPVMA